MNFRNVSSWAIRNPLPPAVSIGQRFACSRVADRVGRALARAAKVEKPELTWRVEGGPAFGNEVATLRLEGREAARQALDQAERVARQVAEPALSAQLRFDEMSVVSHDGYASRRRDLLEEALALARAAAPVGGSLLYGVGGGYGPVLWALLAACLAAAAAVLLAPRATGGVPGVRFS